MDARHILLLILATGLGACASGPSCLDGDPCTDTGADTDVDPDTDPDTDTDTDTDDDCLRPCDGSECRLDLSVELSELSGSILLAAGMTAGRLELIPVEGGEAIPLRFRSDRSTADSFAFVVKPGTYHLGMSVNSEDWSGLLHLQADLDLSSDVELDMVPELTWVSGEHSTDGEPTPSDDPNLHARPDFEHTQSGFVMTSTRRGPRYELPLTPGEYNVRVRLDRVPALGPLNGRATFDEGVPISGSTMTYDLDIATASVELALTLDGGPLPPDVMVELRTADGAGVVGVADPVDPLRVPHGTYDVYVYGRAFLGTGGRLTGLPIEIATGLRIEGDTRIERDLKLTRLHGEPTWNGEPVQGDILLLQDSGGGARFLSPVGGYDVFVPPGSYSVYVQDYPSGSIVVAGDEMEHDPAVETIILSGDITFNGGKPPPWRLHLTDMNGHTIDLVHPGWSTYRLKAPAGRWTSVEFSGEWGSDVEAVPHGGSALLVTDVDLSGRTTLDLDVGSRTLTGAMDADVRHGELGFFLLQPLDGRGGATIPLRAADSGYEADVYSGEYALTWHPYKHPFESGSITIAECVRIE